MTHFIRNRLFQFGDATSDHNEMILCIRGRRRRSRFLERNIVISISVPQFTRDKPWNSTRARYQFLENHPSKAKCACKQQHSTWIYILYNKHVSLSVCERRIAGGRRRRREEKRNYILINRTPNSDNQFSKWFLLRVSRFVLTSAFIQLMWRRVWHGYGGGCGEVFGVL